MQPSHDRSHEAGSLPGTWDAAAPSYDDQRRADPVYGACVRQITHGVPRGTPVCLDAGSGTGLATAPLSRRCRRVVAVDYSLASLKILKGKALPNVAIVQADLLALPFKSGAFDASVCANTLQHLKPGGPQRRAAEELRRVTRAEGSVCVSVHHYSRHKRKAGWIKEGRPGQPGIDYIYRFAPAELARLFPGSPIRGVGYYGLSRIPGLGGAIQTLTARLFGRLAAFFGFGHMLIAIVPRAARRRGTPQSSAGRTHEGNCRRLPVRRSAGHGI